MSTFDHASEPQPVGNLVARVEAVAAKALAKGRAAKCAYLPATALVADAKRCQLPHWPDTTRGVPNIALRSALFGAIGKGSRRYLEREKIFAQDGITIIYTGAQLDEGDLDVWETILHLARAQPLGQDCNTSAYGLLQLLGKKDTGANRKILKRRLSRLNACALDVEMGDQAYYEGSLINEIFRDELSGKFIIRLNPGLSRMFDSDQFTRIHWQVRQALSGKFLAQWLHGYYSSHAAPYPVKVETLRQLSGSKSAYLSKFRQQLREALSALRNTCNAHGQLFDYLIERDLVRIEKTPSKAQCRHLDKLRKTKIPSQLVNNDHA